MHDFLALVALVLMITTLCALAVAAWFGWIAGGKLISGQKPLEHFGWIPRSAVVASIAGFLGQWASNISNRD